MATPPLQLFADALPQSTRALRVHGSEGMNALSTWEVGVLLERDDLDVDAVIGSPATLVLSDEAEQSSRSIGLIITDVAIGAEGRDGFHATLSLAPIEWLLTLRSGYQVYLDKTTQEIVAEVLEDAGIPSDQLVWRLSGNYQKRPHTTRYGETEWSFVERLLADDGISYWFDFEDDKPLLVMGDDPNSHDGLLIGSTIAFADGSGLVAARHFFELQLEEALATTAVHVREYDVRAPDVLIEGKAGDGALEHFEYPACVLNADAADTRAKTRLEQLRRFQKCALGASDCIRVQPGRRLTLEGCADDWMNGDYLVVGVEHEIQNRSGAAGDGSSYHNRVLLVPAGEIAHRPDLPRRAPRVEGLETAVTTGPGGEEIHVDDLGRVKVLFPWDRSGVTDDRSSYWVRCLQMGLGGSMLLPRVGWEVPVGYIDGNPDRPFVLGRVYNATAVVPYGLPGASATTTLQSATSPGGGSTNEIRMGDSGGSQEMFVHASRDHTVTVGGSATTKVSANETHDVALSLIAEIKGSQTLTVGASQSVNVGTNVSTGVKGGRTEMVGGLDLNKVTANRVVAVKGAYTELVGGAYAVQCNQSNTGVTGAFTQLVGGSLTLASGLGTSESTLAARTEIVAGARTINASRSMTESVTGAKSVTAATCTEKAGGPIATDVTAAGSIQIGGSANMKASGLFVIKAATVTLEVSGVLTAKALKLSGGTMHVSSGKTELKGTIKRTGGSSIE